MFMPLNSKQKIVGSINNVASPSDNYLESSEH